MAAIDLSAPAMQPPEGMVSNFDNPPTMNNALGLGAMVLMLIVSTLAVLARCYGRFFVLKQVKPEDILIIMGYGSFLVAMWADLSWLRYPGYFVHTWDVTIETEIQALYVAFMFGVFYSISLGLLKIGIPLEWTRIFVIPGEGTSNYFWWGAMFIIALQSSVLVAIVILLNIQCLPHEAIWDIRLVADAKCIPLPILQKVSASTHFVTDVIMVLLPQKVVWSLNLSLQKKFGLAFVFGLGTLGVVCSVFRLVDTVMLANEPDVFFFTTPVILWCTAEMTCGFIVACAPILPRIVKETYILRRIFGSSSGDTGSNRPRVGPRSTYSNLPRGKRNMDSMFDTELGTMAMTKLDNSESTERLHETSKESDGNLGAGIVRTMQVTVEQDSESRPQKLGAQTQVANAWS